MEKKQQNTTVTDSKYKDDLKDSPRDEARLQPENTTIDMPDVSDIPGQENITVPSLGELSDTTISSEDEEGDEIWDEEIDTDDEVLKSADEDSTVSQKEKDTLMRTEMDVPTNDNTSLRKAALDSYDDEGEPLNEASGATDVSGKDLDTTIVMNDDAMEDIGEEDEENNTYSLGGDDSDNIEDSTNG
ncbi:MAG: hypothetical protein M3R72_11150 [Bacteroidota bacterium]|nr:hypothetical protein [Bacteroidota bacterium]